MAVIENRVTEIGDVLYIQAEVPIIGLVILTDFIDTVGGETIDRYFYKEFRYSRDGINYFPWVELTTDNVAAIQVNPSDTFIIEYRYTRTGTDPSDDLSFSDVTMKGDYQTFVCGTAYQSSIFAQFFSCSDLQVLGWAINVLEKCYKQGIVPTYIERGKDFQQDRDYIDFWRTFTTFFAYIVIYARKFQDFSSVPELLSDYLEQRGMFICKDQEDLTELTYLKENFYREISKRGSLSMLKEQSDTQPVDGELLRLICKQDTDEFVFGLIDSKNSSWSINNSSPVWKGVVPQKHINKGWVDSQDFTDLSLVPSIGTVSLQVDSDKSVLKIQGNTQNEIDGIGVSPINSVNQDLTNFITVSPFVNYKISFQIRQPVDLNNNFTFGILCYDQYGTAIVSKSCILFSNQTNYFFRQKRVNKTDIYYFVEGIIYNVNQTQLSVIDGTCNIGFGNDLVFGSSRVCKVFPFVQSETDSTLTGDGSLYLWDFKMVPYDTNYSTGIVQSTNLIKMWYQNRNVSLQEEDIESNIRQFMIPYSSNLKAIEVSQPIVVDSKNIPFQYSVVKFIWNSGSGINLDIRTIISETQTSFDGSLVGEGKKITVGNGPSPDFYLEWAGNNISDQGVESVLINFIKLSQDLQSQIDFKILLKGFFAYLGTGLIQVELVNYIGGYMKKVGTSFVNIAGQEVSRTVFNSTITSVGVNIDGQNIGEILFSPLTKTTVLTVF